jgi:copper chaperone CopZ
MKTILLLSLALIFSIGTKAQVSKVTLQAAGLTCSMCSNAINKALRSLDYVAEVEADIKTYSFGISFKPNSVVDFDQLRKKVEKAGFSVTSFIATIHFDNLFIKNSQPVMIGHQTFLFTNTSDQLLNGYKPVKILNPGFVSTKGNKRKPLLTTAPNTYHASI